jgi:3-deoxy-D-manno-octulosonic-acid transferase
MSSVALWAYGRLVGLLPPLLRRKLARRAQQEPGYAEAVEERFGTYTQPAEKESELVWVHAVSLGETRTAAVLLGALRAQHPGLRILLTHGTATGRAEGSSLLRSGDVQVWQPWDSPATVARFFDHFKPRLGLLMETEVWPCTVAAARAQGVPLVLVNARLSEKSLKQALRVAPISLPAFGALSAVYAQTEEDAKRFRALGASVQGVFGNLKFDATPDAAQQAQGEAWRQAVRMPVVMFASSREGEESEFLKQIMPLADVIRAQAATDLIANDSAGIARSPRFKPLIVPRHPQRFDEVEALARQQGLCVSRRSSWPAGGPLESIEAMQADVWLGDSLGEMALYYGLSSVALLGGSFAPLGGQNLIEAAACGCPVVMGPYTFNFTEAAELAEAEGAALRVAGISEGVQTAIRLVNEPPMLTKAGNAGLAFAARNRGATARTLEALRGYL